MFDCVTRQEIVKLKCLTQYTVTSKDMFYEDIGIFFSKKKLRLFKNEGRVQVLPKIKQI